jgi:hypothetical protein
MSPVKYELGFYIPEDDILHSPRRENLKYYIVPFSFPAQNRILITSYELNIFANLYVQYMLSYMKLCLAELCCFDICRSEDSFG